MPASDCLNGDLTARARLVAVLCCQVHGEALRRHGGKPRKSADRYPGGQIRYLRDLEIPPTAAMMQRRAEVVGEVLCWHEKASTLIGQAHLLGLLEDLWSPLVSDRQRRVRAQRRYDALEDYVKLHRAVFGIRTAQSNLKNSVAGMAAPAAGLSPADNAGAAARLARMVKRVIAIAPISALIPSALGVLQRVAFDEILNAAGQPDVRLLCVNELMALRLAADALLNDRARSRAPAEGDAEPDRQSRLSSYRPLFTGAGEEGRPDAAALHAAITRLKHSIGER
jgi:hypothetical protein